MKIGKFSLLRGEPYFFQKKKIFVRQVTNLLWCYGNDFFEVEQVGRSFRLGLKKMDFFSGGCPCPNLPPLLGGVLNVHHLIFYLDNSEIYIYSIHLPSSQSPSTLMMMISSKFAASKLLKLRNYSLFEH